MAIDALRRLLVLEPDDVQALNNLAWALRDSPAGLDESIGLAERAVSLAPNIALPWETLAELYFQQRRYQRAVDALKQAITVSTESRPQLQIRLEHMRSLLRTETQ